VRGHDRVIYRAIYVYQSTELSIDRLIDRPIDRPTDRRNEENREGKRKKESKKDKSPLVDGTAYLNLDTFVFGLVLGGIPVPRNRALCWEIGECRC
jgi:hypothetical protein